MAEHKEEKKEGDKDAGHEAKSGGGMMGIILVVVFVVVGVLIGAIVGMAMSPAKKPPTNKKSEVREEAVKEDLSEEHEPTLKLVGESADLEVAEGEEELGLIFPLESFVVNLEGGGYIRCQFQLEFAEKDLSARLLERLVPIRDAVITLLSKKSSKDLLQGRGKETLKNEVKEVVSQILKNPQVKKVYLTNFVVQE